MIALVPRSFRLTLAQLLLPWVLLAQEPPPAPPPPASAAPTPAAPANPPTVAPAKDPAVAPAPATPAAPLRDLTAQPAAAAAPAAAPDAPAASVPPSPAAAAPAGDTKAGEVQTAAPLPAVEKSDADKPAPEKPGKKKPRKPAVVGVSGSGGDAPFGNHAIGTGQKGHEAVSVFGSTTVDGEIADAAVSVFGNTTVNGKVGGDAVAVMGNAIINGEVSGQVVAVMGNVHLGPQSKVRGQIVVVGGRVIRAEGAETLGGVQQVGPQFFFVNFGALGDFFQNALLKARLLWIGEGSFWFWLFACLHLAVYAVLALVLPRAVNACVDTFETRPGMSILAAFLSFLLTPLVFIVLSATVVGLPVAIAALFFLSFFSRTVMHAWIGRLFLRPFGLADQPPVVVAVLVGGVILSLIYCVPVLALVVHALLGALGVGVVIYTLLQSMKKEKRSLPPTTPPSTPGSGSGLGAVPPAPVPPAAPAAAPQSSSVASSAVGSAGVMTVAALAAQPAAVSAPVAPVVDVASAPAAAEPTVPAETSAPPVAPATPVPASAPSAASGVVAAMSPGFGAPSTPPPQPPPPPLPPVPPVSPAAALPPLAALPLAPVAGVPASALPRADFWPRMGALAIDFLLVSVLVNSLVRFHVGMGLLLACMAMYGALLWKVRGTTIGGIIFKLQVVRLDDRPLDWATVAVRGLGCVLSALPVGLGFFWMLFDDEKQTWHDKIAGTTVVKASGSRSLV